MAKSVILWVEDNPDDVRLLTAAFMDSNLDPHFVIHHDAAIASRYMVGHEDYSSHPRPPDLIIVDLNLPVKKGTLIITEIKSMPGWERIPVGVLTSTTNLKELQACFYLGAAFCATKPPSYQGYLDVVQMLRHYLPSSGRGAETISLAN